MPTKRKRIGFLPRAEIQDIIDLICKHNKLSQSKVTGILVEEALKYRGFSCNRLNNSFNNEFHNENENVDLEESSIKDEVQMINDFIEFKFFKNIVNRNKNPDKSVTL